LLRRSQLFVPGSDEAKIRKALSLNSDSIIFDLEDSVPESEKENARALIASMLKELPWEQAKKRELCVRINALATQNSLRDVEVFGSDEKISSLVVPKCESGLSYLKKKSGKDLIPIIETSRGFLSLENIVSSEGVVAVAYGAADFANSMRGRTSAYQNNAYLKTAIAVTAAAYGVDPIDCVFFNLKDTDGFRSEATLARDLGFRGKQVIHPSQIQIANEIFSLSKEEVEWAKRLIELYEKHAKGGKGAISVDGELVDAVHYRWAKSIVEDLK
jgi:citrate lyase subunit beta/citryl-CoA lyase